MKPLVSIGLKHENGKLLVLDQKQLPEKTVWLNCESPAEMATMIKELSVRGAPLIGVAAALALAKYSETEKSAEKIRQAAALLIASRPTAVNLAGAVERLLANFSEMVSSAEMIFNEDVELCERIGKNGAPLIKAGDGVLTHCNAGALATAGIGTALGVIFTAHDDKKSVHVFVDETRPLLQGARLTAWELSERKIPYTLLCDNMSAVLMAQGKVQKIIVGADRIAKNGDFANKIGTYGVSVLALHHKIPFYVAAPHTTFDAKSLSGKDIVVEQRQSAEVQGASGSFGSVNWAPKGCQVFNPSFDVTPAAHVTGFITDKGVFAPKDLNSAMSR